MAVAVTFILQIYELKNWRIECTRASEDHCGCLWCVRGRHCMKRERVPGLQLSYSCTQPRLLSVTINSWLCLLGGKPTTQKCTHCVWLTKIQAISMIALKKQLVYDIQQMLHLSKGQHEWLILLKFCSWVFDVPVFKAEQRSHFYS